MYEAEFIPASREGIRMRRLLIVYGSTEGQTEKISGFLADEFRRFGLIVDVVRAGSVSVGATAYDAVLVAASVHAGGFQRNVVRWVRLNADALPHRPAAFLAVCLGILESGEKARRDLDAAVRRFASRTGWTPPRVKFAAGALKYREYGWLKRMVMRRIAARAGGDTDTSRDHEYTDWADLRAFAREFADALQPRQPLQVQAKQRMSVMSSPREPNLATAPCVMVGAL
jgi:menaquinone-dependent protoporphyrinogen oxidase